MSAAVTPHLNLVFISLGSNIEPQVNLPRSLVLLGEQVNIEAVSQVWETPPIGSSGPSFLNAAARLTTTLSQMQLKFQILRPIEAQLGRTRTSNPNNPRTIDLDILIFNERLVDDEVWIYAHLCVPLAELLPEYSHPQSGETIRQAAERFKHSSPIKLSLLSLEY